MSSFIEIVKRVIGWMFVGLFFQGTLLTPFGYIVLFGIPLTLLTAPFKKDWGVFLVSLLLAAELCITFIISVYTIPFGKQVFSNALEPEMVSFLVTFLMQGGILGAIVGALGPKRIFGPTFVNKHLTC